jgi:Flp pilus assembly protein TadG
MRRWWYAADGTLVITRGAQSFRTLLTGGRESLSGAAAIEFGVVAAILMLMSVALTDVGMGFYRKMQVQNAAQAGARYAMRYGFLSSLIQNAVTAATPNGDIAATPAPTQFCGCPTASGIAVSDCTSTCTDGGAAGSYVSVSAQTSYSTILSYPGLPKTFNLTAQATARVQ